MESLFNIGFEEDANTITRGLEAEKIPVFDDAMLERKIHLNNTLYTIFKDLKILLLSHPSYNENSASGTSEHQINLFESGNIPLPVPNDFKSFTVKSIKRYMLNRLMLMNLKKKVVENNFDNKDKIDEYNKLTFLKSFEKLDDRLCVRLESDNTNNIFNAVYLPHFDKANINDVKSINYNSDDYLFLLFLSKLFDYFIKFDSREHIKLYCIHSRIIRYILCDVYGDQKFADITDDKFFVFIDIIEEIIQKKRMFSVFQSEFRGMSIIIYIIEKFKEPLISSIEFYKLYPNVNVRDSLFFSDS